MDLSPELLTGISGLAAGATLTWFLAGARLRDLAASAAASAAESRAERMRREQAEDDVEAARVLTADLAKQLAVANERVAQGQETLAEQEAFLRSSRRELEHAFRSLAAEALEGSSRQLIALAEERLAAVRTAGTADLEARKEAVAGLVGPLGETLARLDQRTAELESTRADAYARLDRHVELLGQTTEALRQETSTLGTALKGSQARGRWGELALRNAAEAAGMSPHCDFDLQVTLPGGGRPDMLVRLPGARAVAVDAKVPLAAYLRASEAVPGPAQTRELAAHAKALRQHVRDLSARAYGPALRSLPDVDAVEMVVLFVPADPILAAALAHDQSLFADALRADILLATPTTLVALLRTLAIHWQQSQVADNAREIADAARELYERVALFAEHLGGVGRGLETANESYRRATGAFERRVHPMGRRLEELGAAREAKRSLTTPRALAASAATSATTAEAS